MTRKQFLKLKPGDYICSEQTKSRVFKIIHRCKTKDRYIYYTCESNGYTVHIGVAEGFVKLSELDKVKLL